MDESPTPKPPKRVRRPPDLATDAQAEAVRSAIDAAPPEDAVARTLMIEQTRLVRQQLRHIGVQSLSERLGLAIKLVSAVAAGVIGIAALSLIWQASQAHGLVIDAYSVPPDFVQRGLTGEEIAGQIEDRINTLQAGTESSRAPESYKSDWGRDIKVEIPETGVSIGEVQRFLRGWLGHETHVSGGVFHVPEGLRVTARVQGVPGDVFTGPDAQLDSLVSKAAEAVFARSEPYRYGAYLYQGGRLPEARAVFFKLATGGGSKTDQAWGWIGVAIVDENSDRALAVDEIRRAVTLDPNLGLAWSNLASVESDLGREEAALADGRQAVRVLSRPDRGSVRKSAALALVLETKGANDSALQDTAAVMKDNRELAAATNFYGSRQLTPSNNAQTFAQVHDVAAALAWLKHTGADDVAATSALAKYEFLITPHAVVAATLDDWPTVAANLQALERNVEPDMRRDLMAYVWPLEAQALARTGRMAAAESLIGPTPADCYPCQIARAWVAEAKGDAAAADRAFAAAVATGPSLPTAYADWGRVLLDRGRPADAIVRLKAAQRRGPHWADPLEIWGEALMRQGDYAAAIAKFKAADRLAPKWGRNHMRWGEAAWLGGDLEGAREQFRIARGLGMSMPDRAALEVFLKRSGA